MIAKMLLSDNILLYASDHPHRYRDGDWLLERLGTERAEPRRAAADA